MVVIVCEEWSAACAGVVGNFCFDGSVWKTCPLGEIILGLVEGVEKRVNGKSVKEVKITGVHDSVSFRGVFLAC